MEDRRTRVIRATFRFTTGSRSLQPKGTVPLRGDRALPARGEAAAQHVAGRPSARPARKIITDRLYKPPDLDALQAWVEIVMLNLIPLGNVHRALHDGTKVWLSEAERSLDGAPWPSLDSPYTKTP
jgi:hypothetical protein